MLLKRRSFVAQLRGHGCSQVYLKTARVFSLGSVLNNLETVPFSSFFFAQLVY